MARFLLETNHDATDNVDLINQDPDDLIANLSARWGEGIQTELIDVT